MEAALSAYLLASSALVTLVGQRITWDERPQGDSLPSVVLQWIDGVPEQSDEGRAGLTTARLQIDCWAIAWFFATRVGRYVAAIGALLLILAGLALKLIAVGRGQEQARQAADKLKAISKRRASDDKVDAMGAVDRKRALDGWLRDDGKR